MATKVNEFQRQALIALNNISFYVKHVDDKERFTTKVKGTYSYFVDRLKEDNVIDWENLTEKECDKLHFGFWINDEEIDEDIASTKRMFNEGKLSQEECDEQIQEAENIRNLRLIPILLFDLIPEGMLLTTIGGEQFHFDKETADADTRFGYLAYGIKLK